MLGIGKTSIPFHTFRRDGFYPGLIITGLEGGPKEDSLVGGNLIGT